ncbi:MAG: hypothetical protein R2778_11855 [Saprospiraceae bacterium]
MLTSFLKGKILLQGNNVINRDVRLYIRLVDFHRYYTVAVAETPPRLFPAALRAGIEIITGSSQKCI